MSTDQKIHKMNRPYGFKVKVGKSLGRYGITIIRFRNLFLALIVLGVGLLSYNIPKLTIATSLESSFKGHNQAIQDYQEFRDLFGRDDKIVILINSEDIFSKHFLARLKKFAGEDMEGLYKHLVEDDAAIELAKYLAGTGFAIADNRNIEIRPETESEKRLFEAILSEGAVLP